MRTVAKPPSSQACRLRSDQAIQADGNSKDTLDAECILRTLGSIMCSFFHLQAEPPCEALLCYLHASLALD